tara:strand:+ start:361 stop:873 length:513 start_codon:yes stop_codon:yes gene_type:complete
MSKSEFKNKKNNNDTVEEDLTLSNLIEDISSIDEDFLNEDFLNKNNYKVDILDEFLRIIDNVLEDRTSMNCLEFCSSIYLNILGSIEHYTIDKSKYINTNQIFYFIIDELKHLLSSVVVDGDDYFDLYAILYLILVYHEWLNSKKNNNRKRQIKYYKMIIESWNDLIKLN